MTQPHLPRSVKHRMSTLQLLLPLFVTLIFAAPLASVAQSLPRQSHPSLPAQIPPDKQAELDQLNSQLRNARTTRDGPKEGGALVNIAMFYAGLGDERTALGYFTQALPLVHAVGNRSMEAATLKATGEVCADIGEYKKSIDFLNQAVTGYHAISDPSNEASTLSEMSLVYLHLDKKQEAIDQLDRALLIVRANNDHDTEAVILDTIGKIYESLGEKQKALEYHKQSLDLKPR